MPRPQIEFQALVGQLPGASEAALLMPSEVASQVNSNALLEPSKKYAQVLVGIIYTYSPLSKF